MHKQMTDTSCAIAAALHVAAKHCAPVAKYHDLSSAQVRVVQHRVHDIAAHSTLPWPKQWGTAPWAMVRLLSSATGETYRVAMWGDRAQKATRIALERGHDVALYTGGGTLQLPRRLCHLDIVPRHVVTICAPGTGVGPTSAGRADSVPAGRVQTARTESERVESGRVEAERVEAERVEAGRVEAGRADAGRADAAPIAAKNVADRVEIFEPHEGRLWHMSWDEFVQQAQSCEKVGAFGNWRRVILTVLPESDWMDS